MHIYTKWHLNSCLLWFRSYWFKFGFWPFRGMYHQYYISRLHKNATISDEAVGCEKHPCPSGTGLSPLMREMKMNDYHEQLPCSLENQHYCTKVLQLHWVSNQAPGQPCQGLLGGHVKASSAAMSGAPGWPRHGLLGSYVRASWVTMLGAPGQPCQGLLGSHVRCSWKVISGAPRQPSQSHQGAQQAPGSGRSVWEVHEEAKLVWIPFSCRKGNKQPCAWSAARGQAHFLVKLGKQFVVVAVTSRAFSRNY